MQPEVTDRPVNETTPSVSVILVSWNRREELIHALDSVYLQEGITPEVIVIDNGSSDGTVEMLHQSFPSVVVIRNNTNRGACHGKNQGILAATGDYIAFMDSDAVLLNPHTLVDLRDRLSADPSLGAVAGPIYIDLEQQIPWVFGIHLTDDLYIDWDRTRQGFGPADALSTCFVMLPRIVSLRVGGFDPVYFYQHEDLDFFIRMGRLGYHCEVVEGYPVWHHISEGGRKLGRMFWMHFREEWRHQYLLIKNTGTLKATFYFLRNLYDSSRMRAYYVRCIRHRKFVALFMVMPLFMLTLSPWIVWQRRRNPLHELETGPDQGGSL